MCTSPPSLPCDSLSRCRWHLAWALVPLRAWGGDQFSVHENPAGAEQCWGVSGPGVPLLFHSSDLGWGSRGSGRRSLGGWRGHRPQGDLDALGQGTQLGPGRVAGRWTVGKHLEPSAGASGEGLPSHAQKVACVLGDTSTAPRTWVTVQEPSQVWADTDACPP